MEFVITDNAAEKLTLKWDGERFALVWEYPHQGSVTKLITPREMRRMEEVRRSVEVTEYHEGGRKE